MFWGLIGTPNLAFLGHPPVIPSTGVCTWWKCWDVLGCAGTFWVAGGPTSQWDPLRDPHTSPHLPSYPVHPSQNPAKQQAWGKTTGPLTQQLNPRAPAPQPGHVLEPEHLRAHLQRASGHAWPCCGLLSLHPLPLFAVSRCCRWFFMAGGAALHLESESLRGKWDPITETLFPCPVFFANEILQNLSVLVCVFSFFFIFLFFPFQPKASSPVPFKRLRIGRRDAMRREGMNIYHRPGWVGELINVPAINPAAPAGTLNQLVNAKWLRSRGWGERPSPRCAIYLSAFDDSQRRRFEEE